MGKHGKRGKSKPPSNFKPPKNKHGEVWAGIHKLQEELGELQLELGKLCAFPSKDHPDGTRWKKRLKALIGEATDVRAALHYFADTNKIVLFDTARFADKLEKYERFGLKGVTPRNTKAYKKKKRGHKIKPNVVARVIDQTKPVRLPSTLMGAVICGAQKGPNKPRRVRTELGFKRAYGVMKPKRVVSKNPNQQQVKKSTTRRMK
jgi:hypothetical protein